MELLDVERRTCWQKVVKVLKAADAVCELYRGNLPGWGVDAIAMRREMLRRIHELDEALSALEEESEA